MSSECFNTVANQGVTWTVKDACPSAGASSLEPTQDGRGDLGWKVLAKLKEWGVDQVTELQGKAENVVFAA